jgi:thiol-disulfide isomerase/thioredoxin
MHFIVKSHQDAKKLCHMKKKGPWMILYKANWCGHCQMLAPEWKKFMMVMKSKPQLNIAEVDSDYMSSMDEQVMGYPTIKMYNNNNVVSEFEEERNVSGLQRFAISNMPKVSKPTRPVKIVVKRSVSRKPRTMSKKPVKMVVKKSVSRKPRTMSKRPVKMVVKKPVSRKSRTMSKRPVKMVVKKPVSRKPRKMSKKPVVKKSRKSSQNLNLIKRMKKQRMSTQLSNKNIITSLRKSLSNIQKQSMNDKRLLRDLVSRK